MSFELDHVFVAASADAPEIRLLASAGFLEGPARDHPGQGTASRGVFFENAYLELIWLTDREIAETPPIRRTGLAERADPRRAASPFGFALRSPQEPAPDPPFDVWRYSPPYLPEGASFAMGANSTNLQEPLLFVLPWSRKASWDLPAHPNGVRRLTGVTLVTGGQAPSEELTAFYGLRLVSVEDGVGPALRLEFDQVEQGQGLDLRPHLPLELRW
jgi:hypothetical protein